MEKEIQKPSTRQDILNDRAEFTWDFGQEFYVKTENYGSYIWSDPDYRGDNTFKQTALSYEQHMEGMMGRDKGVHNVERYCGDQIEITLFDGTTL